ncbi:50S ribosomal protein L24 [Lachnobacterium bovis]|jgi:large subunit ribosomal protein L24|uniref:Large ribosomal subunit protein uL24 n=1 Tax=Lachnobacterium bovis DSM 14045 TaxID=1122142 RepID=A0A1H3H8I0_9FIRM|nr:50S ribosomal protein L24 [Lachnobacterium sp.]SDY11188.1 large subunit ribosomal protein L24 [Lachnobacterium bovis DSM 14045]
MASMKIKKGDNVVVIAGRYKDQEGKVIAVNKKDNSLIVEGVNMVTKHAKPSMANQQGGIIQKEGKIDASNVMLMHNGVRTRVGFRVEDGKKVRFAKKTGDVIDTVIDKKKVRESK